MSWGPWVKHDGSGCPLPIGTEVEINHGNGVRNVCTIDDRSQTPFPTGMVNMWFWFAAASHSAYWPWRIIEYRTPRSDAGEALIQSVRDMEPIPESARA